MATRTLHIQSSMLTIANNVMQTTYARGHL